MAGFFNLFFFFTTGRIKRQSRFLILQLLLILSVILQIIYIYLLHVYYSQLDYFFEADLSTKGLEM